MNGTCYTVWMDITSNFEKKYNNIIQIDFFFLRSTLVNYISEFIF